MKVKNIPFKSIIDRSKDLYWSVDQSLRLIYANEAFSSALLALTGKIIQQGEIIVLEDQWNDLEKTWKEHYKKAFSGISFEIGEQYHSPITKETIFLSISFLPIPSEEGAIEMVMCHCKDVTTQKLSDEEARKMMDASLDVICTIDVSGNFKKVSGASLHLWGFTPVELQGKPYINLVYEEDIEKTNTVAESVMAGIDTTSFENRYIKKDGTIVPISWSARWDADSQIMYCIARNATEKIQKKEATRVVENRYKTLIQNGSDLIGLMDAKGNYLYVSPTSKTILGIDPKEFIGKSAFDFIHPDDKKEVYAQFIEILKGKTTKINPFRFQNKEGNWKWIETIATNMLNNPDIKGIIANSRDVTERVNQENKLKKSQEQYQMLFNRGPLPKWIYDVENFEILDANQSSLTQYGYSYSEFLSKTIYDLLPNSNSIGNATEKQKIVTVDEPISYGIELHQKKNGALVKMDIYGHPVTFEGKSAMLIVGNDVTEKEGLLEALNQSETKLKKATSIAHLGYWRLELDGQKLHWSDEVYKIWGQKKEDFAVDFQQFYETIYLEDRETFQQEQDAAFAGTKELNFEHRIILPDSSIRWVHQLARLIYVANGNPNIFEGTVQDITEQKIAALQLLKNEKRYRALIENSADAVVILDSFGKAKYASPSVTNVLGYSEEEALQLNLFELIHPKDIDGVSEKMTEVLSKPGVPVKGYTSRTKHKDGSWRWLEATITNMLHDPDIEGIIDNFRDITDQKKEEQHLKLLESVITHTNDSVIITEAEPFDKQGPRIIYVNEAFTRMTGYSLQEVIGKTPRILQGPKSDKAELKKLSQAIRNWEPCEITTINYKKNKDEFWINFAITPVADEKGWFTHWIAIEKDVTEKRKNAQLLQDATQIARVGSWEVIPGINKILWSDITYDIHELPTDVPLVLEKAIEYYREDFRELVSKNVQQCILSGNKMDFEAVLITQNKKERWVRVVGKGEFVNDQCIRIFGSIQDIHEKKGTELRFQNTADNIPGAIFQYQLFPDGKDRWMHLSKGALKLWELPIIENKDYGGLIWSQIEMGGDFDLVQSTLQKSAADLTRWQCQFRNRLPSGKIIWLEGIGAPRKLPDGSIIWDSLVFNITELKNSTENLLKAFVEKNKILESIGDAFFTMDRHFTVSYWNKAAEYLLDTPRENIIGKNLYEVFPDGLNANSYEIYKKVLQTGEPVTFEEYFGLWLEINAHPSDEGLSIFFRDITLRKETDLRILKANERFEKVVEATDDSIWDWEIINDVFYRSKGFVKLFGLKTTFILSEKDFWKDNFHPDDLSQIKESLQKALKDKTCTKWEQEYRIIYDEVTTKTVFDRGLIIRNEEGTPIRMVGAITDISYRKKHEEALLALNDSLKKYTSELEITNEQLEQFAFIASHDLQEPLRMISSFLNQLERKYAEKLDEKALQYIHFATDGAKRMRQIILDLLEYSRAGKFQEQQEELDLKLILEEYTILRRKMISDSEAIIQTDPLPIIKGYKAPLTQTLHCLLDNAIKYSKKGVTPIIKISFQSKANEWEVGIHDNGIGIDPKFFDKIFIIFQRLHNREEYEGTGIGLSIAKKHIETWGGRIWLISVPNIGSSFYFTLPRQISIKN